MVEAGQERGVPADVVALLADRRGGAHHQVVGLGKVDVRIALDQSPDRDRRELVGAHGLERSLARTADRCSDGVHNDGFWHLSGSCFGWGSAHGPLERPGFAC
jgi:hypothetical protein